MSKATEKNQIYFNFSYKALKLLGEGLYSNPWTAISELIANGIDADASKIFLYINMIDKERSTIEIFDNGYGMSYDDLVEKYSLIGLNKRMDVDLDEKHKAIVTGRKGIGKLAALYLSPTYYLNSRTKTEESTWCLDVSKVSDNDRPSLQRQNNIFCEASRKWQICKTGTFLKLINVDLRNIGEQTLAGLKARIADYYSFENAKIEIYVALRQKSNEKINFEKIEKQIAFKNFYAFFNNTKTDFSDKLSNKVYLKTTFQEKMPGTVKINNSYYKECLTQKTKKDFITSGKSKFLMDDGKLSDNQFTYEMIGWLGIHSTIRREEAEINDPSFLKNRAYQPNRLRLYVRNKLAMENFMDYLNNTQALSPYIEGEIHFDILDSNDLPDIATASRQGYKINNDRVQKLIEILKPIINTLISVRSAVGTKINEEEKKYWQKKEDDEKAKKEKAEADARAAKQAKDEAERKQHEAEVSKKQAEEALNIRKQQTYFLEAALTIDNRTLQYNTHVIKCNAEDIESNIKYLLKDNPELKNNKELLSIAFAANKILMTSQNFSIINYDFERNTENDDLGYFIEQYFKSTAIEDPKISIKIENNSESYIRFPFQNITMMLYNIVSNAKKAEATELNIEMVNDGNFLVLRFIDNGIGIEKNIDLDSIFDLGVSYRYGTGIGLAQVKDLVYNELKGTISVSRNPDRGITLEVIIPNESNI